MTSVLPVCMYPQFTRNVGVHWRPDGGQLHIGVVSPVVRLHARRDTPAVDMNMGGSFELDGFLLDYLSAIDGQRTLLDLRQRMIDLYGPWFGVVFADQAEQWIHAQPGLLQIADAPTPTVCGPDVTGSVDGFYPVHCMFEIIETCNFTCSHCYYQSSPLKTGRISVDDAVAVMDRLAANGVRVIELTGGECTLHPSFPEILAHASSTFDIVAIITNGYLLGTSESISRSVCETPNVIVQVSIDALGERHDAFRKHRGAFDAAVKAIQRLRAAGIVTRIASSISEANVDQISPLYHLAKSLDVQRLSFAPVAPLGRGCNISDPGAGTVRLMEAIWQELAPFAKDPILSNLSMRDAIPHDTDASLCGVISDSQEPRNCGAGWRTITVDYDGNVRACNFSRDSKKFGNLIDNEYSSLYSQQASFFFHNAPSPGGRDCDGCSYRSHCSGCFVKAFMVSESEYPECPWRRKWFPGMSLQVDQDSAFEATQTKRARLPIYTSNDHPTACASCRCHDNR